MGSDGGLRGKLRELFAVDLRSLALLRIGLGVSVLVDLTARATDLVGLYTDQGVLPRDLLLALEGRHVYFSAHYWASAHPALQAALFGVTAGCAIALLLGWRTWLANAACWYLVASVQVRQPEVYMGGDSILRLLLFWGLFVPLGARFSLDALRGRVIARPDRLTSAATVALLLQVCLIYWATGVRKSGDLWWNGQAVFYALHSELATPFGEWMLAFPSVLGILTYGTLFVELFGPFVAFVPFYNPAFRVAAILLFWGFHAGLAASMNIGLFPLFSMVAWVAFVPSQLWERVSLAGATRQDLPIVPSRRWRLANVGAGILLTYVVVLLAERADIIPQLLPRPVLALGQVLRIQQSWVMFAPNPATSRAYFEMQGLLANGTKMTTPAATSFRWQIYLGRAAEARATKGPLAHSLVRFAQHHCAAWNGVHVDSPPMVRVALVGHVTSLSAKGSGPPSTRTFVDTRCDGL
jgi:hypothetical protein